LLATLSGFGIYKYVRKAWWWLLPLCNMSLTNFCRKKILETYDC